MKKKMILNICMVIMILLVIVCGVVAVGSVKGWFDGDGEVMGITVSEKSGIAMIERSGVAYEIEEGTVIRKDDQLYTKAGSSLIISDEDANRIYLGQNAEIAIRDLSDDVQLEVLAGESLIDARQWKSLKVYSDDSEIILDQAVVSISAQAGSTMIYVYSGEVTAGSESFKAGEVVSVVNNGNPERQSLEVNSLNEFQMDTLIACGMDESFCITEKDIETVKKEREEEKLRVQQELLEAEKEDESTASGSGGSGGDASGGNGLSGDSDEGKKYCTIQIRCDTILNNLGNLRAGKEAYVPANGIILATSQLAFEEGETVFDVLQRACNLAGIQIEYSYTPIYESYYIEGLNHIYEFDCGNQSGWMYKVNGWFPNYGCSSYTLEDGDNIVWCYTCNGLGADVGGSNYR